MTSPETIIEPTAEKIKISELVFDQTNPNKMTPKQMQGLRESMKRFGYLTPIVIDQNNKIADGEHRALVYRENKIEEIPAFRVQLNSDVDRRMLRQVMNKLHGEHEKQLDADELAIIFKEDKLDELSKLVAQDKEDFQRLILRYHPGLDFVTAENEADVDRLIDEELKRQVPDTQLGDLYELGSHRLVCGDCTDKRIIGRLFQGSDKARLALLDPPYGVDYTGATEEKLTIDADEVTDEQRYHEFLDNTLRLVDDVLDVNCVFYLFHSHTQQPAILRSLDEAGYKVRAQCIWVKNNAVGNGYLYRMNLIHYRQRSEPIYYCQRKVDKFAEINWYGGQSETTVWEFDRPAASREHPTTKPVELYQKAIRNSSKRDEVVFDPMLGSGSTLIACEQTQRKCYAIEIDPHYCDVIIKRWEKYTNKKAVKL